MVAYFTALDRTTLARLQHDPSQLDEFLFPNDGDDEPDRTMDTDKAWHGIHFILSAIAGTSDSALRSTILGGSPLGEDLGYGPARILQPAEVGEIASALAGVSDADFTAAFDPAAMDSADIYPQIWVRDGAEALSYLQHFFPALVKFYAEAATRGDGMILWMA